MDCEPPTKSQPKSAIVEPAAAITFEGLSAARSSIARLQNARDTLVERSRASTDGAASSARLAALLEEAVSAAQVKKLARARHLARRQKDWKTADAIRDHLKKCGVQFEDISDGVRYKLP